MVSRAPQAALLALMTGCLGPNPYLPADDDVGTSEASTDSTDASTTLDSESTTNPDTTTSETTGPGSCTNAMLDGNETAIDCGGDCPACEDGEACLDASDCKSGVCDETCQPAACDDQVFNGDEVELDCGGSCSFCELSAFIPAWDDVDADDAVFPSVAISEAGEIALDFSIGVEPRLRWFQAMGAPLTSSAKIGEMLIFVGGRTVPIVLRDDLAEASALALVAGVDAMSSSTDMFMVEHALAGGEGPTRTVFQGSPVVVQGAIASVSTRAALVWRQDKQILLRRRDFSVANGEWIDIGPIPAESDPAQFDGEQPDLAVAPDGTLVLAWSRCAKAGTPCAIVVRRFDGDWIESAPVEVSTAPSNYLTAPHVAVDDQGRVALSWSLVDLGVSRAFARILGADLTPEGEPWLLQNDLPFEVETDVAALDDGSFAYVWADPNQDRVHLRRYIGNDVPKLMDVGDEAPWPTTTDPTSPALANANHRLVVVWSATDGSFKQIHGQVLSY